MKNIIYTAIALVFILGSYYIGYDRANNNCNEKVNDLNEQINSKEQSLKELQDSLTLIRKQLIECASKHNDTLKVQLINSATKGNKK